MKTGLVFIGFEPYSRARSYKISPLRVRNDPATGKMAVDVSAPEEASNHLRAHPFDWVVVLVLNVRGYPLKVVIGVTMQCVNPQRTLAGVDDWTRSFGITFTGIGMTLLQDKDIVEVMNGICSQELRKNLESLDTQRAPWMKNKRGLRILEAQVITLSDELMTEVQRRSLSALQVAEQAKLARLKEYAAEAEGQADVLTKRLVALAQHGELGRHESEMETLETMAKSGGNGMIINVTMGGVSQTAATDLTNNLLARQQNRGGA
ncbi:MAG: hypothetical protein ACOYMG_13940 [Candidatus Methylumidiphilus sp.]